MMEYGDPKKTGKAIMESENSSRTARPTEKPMI